MRNSLDIVIKSKCPSEKADIIMKDMYHEKLSNELEKLGQWSGDSLVKNYSDKIINDNGQRLKYAKIFIFI